MITTLPPQPTRPAKPARPFAEPGKPNSAMASDYRLLGLRPREARVDVIREAVHQAANQVQLADAARNLATAEASTSDSSLDDSQQQLSQIAVAGYRLLDPRRRRTLFERVQLLMWTEEELDASLNTWASQPAVPKVTIALKPARQPSASTVVSNADENQVALELFRSLRQRDRRALALWIGLAGLTVSLALTLTLFAYFA